jgi:hypothetical protein
MVVVGLIVVALTILIVIALSISLLVQTMRSE